MANLAGGPSAAHKSLSDWTPNYLDTRPPNNVACEQADSQANEAKQATAGYLRDLGVCDPALIATMSEHFIARAHNGLAGNHAEGATTLAEAAIQLAVDHFNQWRSMIEHDVNDENAPAQHRKIAAKRFADLLHLHGEACLKMPPSEAIIESMREELCPIVPEPRPQEMQDEPLNLVPSISRWTLWTRRLLFHPGSERTSEESGGGDPSLSHRSAARRALAVLTVASTIGATWLFCAANALETLGLLRFVGPVLFAVLFSWVAFSFWVATLGLLVILFRPKAQARSGRCEPPSTSPPRTAIVMPIYNEDPHKVFANIRAIVDSLDESGHAADFDVFVLSDTTAPESWLQEELAWADLAADLRSDCHVFYRHRPQNRSRKSGNIADFCSRWGAYYRYMVVLDADSVMAGDTLAEMVSRMERDPRIGILQAPPRPVNRLSFFARMQQFAAYLYGPVFLEGFVLWSQCDGNYWGHNAIIRIKPFMKHCKLPVLPGDGPLGGEILSHDFVEAALMRRAGWKVCIAHDLEGSYEECPTTILDFAQRDQRWCQGNLQHIRLLLAEGFHPASRLHFGMGAMSYLASPLWMAFLALTLLGALSHTEISADQRQVAPGGGLLFAITMAMLLLPKLWGVIALARRTASLPHVPFVRALGSVLIETIASMLIAPIMMMLQTRFVIATLLGRKARWGAQRRDDVDVSFRDAISAHYVHTTAGLALGGLAWFWTPHLLAWLMPVLLGLLLSILLALLLGNAPIGMFLKRFGLLSIPEEISLPPILRLQRDALALRTPQPAGDLFSDLLRDPIFYALHAGILRATESDVPLSPQQSAHLAESVATGQAVPKALRRAVLGDGQVLEGLHVLVRSGKLALGDK